MKVTLERNQSGPQIGGSNITLAISCVQGREKRKGASKMSESENSRFRGFVSSLQTRI